MKLWKYLVILAMVFCLAAPVALFADEGEPEAMDEVRSSFQNPTQADRAERIADATFSEAAAEDAVNAYIEQITEDYAYRTAYDEAYTYAVERAMSDAFSPNAYQTIYDDAISRGASPDRAEAWATSEVERIANEYAVDEAVPGNETYDDALAYAEARATSEDFHPNAYDTAYEKYYAEYIGATYEDIHKMRFEKKMGWGQITRYYGLHSSINGSKKRARINEEEIVPRDPEAIPLDEEIAEMTRIDTKTGWNDTAGFNGKNKNKNSKKTYGLTQTSGVATSDVQGNKAVNRGQSKKNNKSSSSTQTTTSTSSRSGQGGSPGLASSSSKNNGNKGGNKSNNGNKSSSSSNNGNKGGKDNGNSNKGGKDNGNSNKGGNGNGKGNNK